MAYPGTRNKKGVKRIITKDGYIDIFEPKHPMSKGNGYVAEHRKVWFDAGKTLEPGEDIHHINHNKQDNRLENLEKVTRSAHAIKYNAGGWETRRKNRKSKICKVCGAEHYGYLNLCKKCYKALWARKKYNYKKFKSKRIHQYFEEQGLI